VTGRKKKKADIDQESTQCIPSHIRSGWKDLVLPSALQPIIWDPTKHNLLQFIEQYLPNNPGKAGKAELRSELQELCFKRGNNRSEVADMREIEKEENTA